jgi:hypothetical protein
MPTHKHTLSQTHSRQSNTDDLAVARASRLEEEQLPAPSAPRADAAAAQVFIASNAVGVVAACATFVGPYLIPLGLALAVMIVIGSGIMELTRRPVFASLDSSRFERLYARWEAEHGPPPGVIKRRPAAESTPEVEADVGDYSFDRAVICDRARTVDLLLANNFHFENNCAILSVDGYPQGPFETVRSMLKRNPRLAVYALHDATPAGCRLARTLAQDPAWFAGIESVLVTSGASVPEDLVHGVIEALIERFGGEVEQRDVYDERVEFGLPGTLRELMRGRGLDPDTRRIRIDREADTSAWLARKHIPNHTVQVTLRASEGAPRQAGH